MSVFAPFKNRTHSNRVPNSDYIRTENESTDEEKTDDQPVKPAQPETE